MFPRASGSLFLKVQDRRLHLARQSDQVPLSAVSGGRCGNADDLGQRQVHLVGHEVSETAEAEVVAVGAFVHVLLCVEAGNRQAIIARRGERNLLETWETSLALICMVQSRVDERGL